MISGVHKQIKSFAALKIAMSARNVAILYHIGVYEQFRTRQDSLSDNPEQHGGESNPNCAVHRADRIRDLSIPITTL